MSTLRQRRLGLLGAAAALIMAVSGLAVSSAWAYPVTQSTVTITKSWSAGPVSNGANAVATFQINNPTGGPQKIYLQDTYDSGLTYVSDTTSGGCAPTSYPGYPMRVCTHMAAAGLSSVTITFKVNYAGPAVYTTNNKTHERLTVQKQEENWNLFADEVKTFSISCPAGYFMVDQSLHKTHVDQDAGTFEDVHVVTTNLTHTNWSVTIENKSLGQAQGKLWAACMKKDTNLDLETLTIDPAMGVHSSTPIPNFQPVGDVPSEFIATCASGFTPVALNLKAASPGFWQDELFTQVGLYANGGPSAVLFAIIHEPSNVTLQWRCLKTTSSTGNRMQFEVKSKNTNVNAGKQKEFSVSCEDDQKGIIGGWSGHHVNGHEPRPKIRTYWLRNLSSATVKYTAKLLCVENRLVKGGTIKSSATDERCNYGGGVHEPTPGTEYWLNHTDACIKVTQGP